MSLYNLFAVIASAQTLETWQGPNNGIWSNPANWNPNGVPNNSGNTITYNARVDAGNNNVSLDISPIVTNYTQASGSLIGNGTSPTLYVNNVFTWNSGTIDQLSLDSYTTATLAKMGTTNPTLGNAILNLYGTANMSISPLDGLTGATINNYGTWTINAASSLNDLSNGVAPAPALNNNAGTINKAGNGTATVAWATTTSGTIESMAGELKFTGGLQETGGKILVDQGATLTSTTNILVNDASIGGAGTVNGSIELENGDITGAPTPGKLLVVGNLRNYDDENIGASAIATFDSAVGGPGPWPDYCDQVEVDGNVELPQQLAISVWPGYTPPPSYEYDVLVTTGTLSGYFQNALPGQRILSTDGNWSFVVNYESGAYAQEVALTDFQPVPEPSVAALLGLAGASLLCGRRRAVI